MKPKIRVTFDKPRGGYWDGGEKSGGDFEVDEIPGVSIFSDNHPGTGHQIKWGCWGLNFFFTCSSGRSWKEAASIAKRWIDQHITASATTEIIWAKEDTVGK